MRNDLKAYHPTKDPDSPQIFTVIKCTKDRMSVGNVERCKLYNKNASKIRLEHPNLSEHCYPHMARRTFTSVEMMRKAMESGKILTDEKTLWSDDEAETARICGLR